MSTGRVLGQLQGSTGVLRVRAGRQALHQGVQLTAVVFFNHEEPEFFE